MNGTKRVFTTITYDKANRLEQQLMNDMVQLIPTSDAVHIDLSGTYLAFQTTRKDGSRSVFPSERSTPATTSSWSMTTSLPRGHW